MDPWSMTGMTPYGAPMQQGYPTMPNQYGIGAQIDTTGGGGYGLSPIAGGPAGPEVQPGTSPWGSSQPSGSNLSAQAVAGSGSQGWGPWSLVGEANVR